MVFGELYAKVYTLHNCKYTKCQKRGTQGNIDFLAMISISERANEETIKLIMAYIQIYVKRDDGGKGAYYEDDLKGAADYSRKGIGIRHL